MCLYPRLIKNPRYKPNKKNGGNVPEPKDPRELSVAIGCGVCEECLKQKKHGWTVRLLEEIKEKRNGWMVTLTFSEKSINEFEKIIANNDKQRIVTDEEVAKLAVKRFRERWRKEHKTSLRHWFITEHGHNGTERLHLHGIIFTDIDIKKGFSEDGNKNRITHSKSGESGIQSDNCYLAKKWGYGIVHIGKYCSERTINYIMKYVTKRDQHHSGYVPRILTSPGMGRNYTSTTYARQRHSFKGKNTCTTYNRNDGSITGLPIYWRNKLWDENQRVELWMAILDKNERWVLGVKVDISKGEDNYYQRLEWAQKDSERRGYPNPKWWRRKRYSASRKDFGLEIPENHVIQHNFDNTSIIIWNFVKDGFALYNKTNDDEKNNQRARDELQWRMLLKRGGWMDSFFDERREINLEQAPF